MICMKKYRNRNLEEERDYQKETKNHGCTNGQSDH